MNDRLGDTVRLKHMLNAITEIENYTKGLLQADFENNSLVFYASLMQIEIIGEASSRLSDNIILVYTDIPWRNIKGLRNIIVHEYFGIDKNAIWDVIENELPDLKLKINNIIENNSDL
jgi:uncharacterized protein with HEPN domain